MHGGDTRRLILLEMKREWRFDIGSENKASTSWSANSGSRLSLKGGRLIDARKRTGLVS